VPLDVETLEDGALATWSDTAEAVEDATVLAVDADKLAACLESLAERERTVVVMTFFAEKSGDEVARELGLTTGNVRVIRHRALARLRGA